MKEIKDQEIDFSDIPPLQASFFSNAVLRLPKAKTPITLRLDQDVLAWFKNQGQGYQTKMNSVLRAFMELKNKVSKSL